MKHTYFASTAFFILMSGSLASYAADAEKMQPPAQHKGMAGGMGEMSEEQMMAHYRKRQEHILMMHDLSTKILAETDAAKKEQLKLQQIELMKADHARMMAHHKGKMNHAK